MTSRNMVRCRKCPFFIENEKSVYICSEYENGDVDVDDISNKDCPLNDDY